MDPPPQRPNPMDQAHQQRGFNLFELSMALAISAILLSLAVPAMTEFRARQQLRAVRTELYSSLQLARIEAVTHAKHVVLCPSTDGAYCANGTRWDTGWIVFLDLDKDRERSVDEALMWVGSVDAQQVRISTSRGRTRIRYSPLGTAPGTNLSIKLCHQALPQTSSKLIVSNAGRVRILADAGSSSICGA